MHRSTRSTAMLLLLVLPLSACHKWVPPELRPGVAPDSVVAYDQVRVTRVDGSSLVLHGARLSADSLVGDDEPSGTRRQPLRVALPRHEIESLEVRRTDVGATVLTALGVAAVAIGLTALLCVASDCFSLGGGSLFGE